GAEHALRGRVVRRELRLPLREVTPRPRLEEVALRRREGVRVDERAAADAHPVKHGDVLEERHLEDAAEPGLRHPVPAPEVPVGLRKILWPEAPTFLEDENSVA